MKHLTHKDLQSRWRYKSRQAVYNRIARLGLKPIGGGRPLFRAEDVERAEIRAIES